MWQALYNSPLHHPLASWLATAALALWLWRAGSVLARPLRLFLAWFCLEMAVDALWTGGWSPVSAGHPLQQPVAILWVILGDYRFFALGELQRAGYRRGWWTGLAWTLVVPVLHGLCIRLLPALFADVRVIFLAYELAQAAMVALWWSLRGRGLEGLQRDWLGAVTAFELVQYLGWAGADVVILSGVEQGHGLRMVPNLMYYAGFLALVAWLAPRVTGEGVLGHPQHTAPTAQKRTA